MEENKNNEIMDEAFGADEYYTLTDEDGNEHSLDYDNYCDECDDYHEE